MSELPFNPTIPDLKKTASKRWRWLGLPAAGRNPRKKKLTLCNWRIVNRERYNKQKQACKKLSRSKNVEEYRKKDREYAANRNVNPEKRIVKNLRTRIYIALVRGRGSKSIRTLELIGCTITELREHLESKFKFGMTWENYGPVWHIDHRKPCASFDLRDSAQQRECFHFSNLQPLFAEENLSKHDNCNPQ